MEGGEREREREREKKTKKEKITKRGRTKMEEQ